MKESPENTEEYRYKIRHSAAHLLAEAVLKKHPDAKLTIGPPIDDGFVYDFDVDITFSPQDLASIERDMKRSVKRNTKFERNELSKKEALEIYKDNPYKIESLAFLDYDIPPKINEFLEKYADRKKIFESILLNKLEGFFSDLEWSLDLNPYLNALEKFEI